ncbi:MAG: lipid II flippase MurJ [Candidatus Zixiibacteriota bacterium]
MRSRILRAVIGVAGVVFVSKLLGLLREMVIARQFGTSAEYDVYLIGVMLPALLAGVLAFASYFLTVPYLTRLFTQTLETGAARTRVWSSFNVTVLVAILVTILTIFAAPWLMRFWGGGYDEARFAQVIFYSRMTAGIILLTTTEAFLRAALNARDVVTYPAAGLVLFNVIAVGTVLLFSERYGVGAIALGLIAGLLAQNLMLVVRALPSGLVPQFTTSFSGNDIRPLGAVAGLLILTELLNRSYFLIDRYFAPRFGDGIIAALNYSQVLVQLPDAIVGFSIASVLFPLFAEHSADNDEQKFSYLFHKAIIGGLLVAVPLAVLFFTNASDIIQLIFRRGQFDTRSTEMTAAVLRPYVPAIVALFAISTSIRACYAQGWVKQVLGLTLGALVLKFITTSFLSDWFGYPGISMATSVSQVTLSAALLWLVMRLARTSASLRLVSSIARLVVIGLICTVTMYFLNPAIGRIINSVAWSQALSRVVVSAACLGVIFSLLAWFSGFDGELRKFFAAGASSPDKPVSNGA